MRCRVDIHRAFLPATAGRKTLTNPGPTIGGQVISFSGMSEKYDLSAIFDEHVADEFVAKDVAATMSTMTAEPRP